MLDEQRIRSGLAAAHQRFLKNYAKWGGHRYRGWREYGDPANNQGVVILSEGDCVHRLALELEKEFPRQVHSQFKLNQSTRADFVKGRDRKQTVDLVIADLGEFADPTAGAEPMRSRRHELFIEAKWFPKGWLDSSWQFDGRGRIAEVADDLGKLSNNLARGHCALAAMLIVQDEDFFDIHRGGIHWPQPVIPLMVGPGELKRRGLLGLAV